MKFLVTQQSLAKLEAKALVLFIQQQDAEINLSPFGQLVDDTCNGMISRLINNNQLNAKREHIDVLLDHTGLQAQCIVLVGVGIPESLSTQKTRKLMSTLINTLEKRNITSVAISLADYTDANSGTDASAQAEAAQLLVEACYSCQYKYTETLGKNKALLKEPVLEKFELIIENSVYEGTVKRHIAIGQAIGEGTNLTKDLSNMPGNVCTPTYLAQTAQQIGKEFGIATSVLDEAKMKKLGMGSLLSVSKGSREPAKLIIMEYNGGNKKEAPIVLVGKGLTFDAGGISIKPAAAMDEMKYDMCGGASVIGVMRTLGELKLPINVVGVVASSENLPDGAANKPGDVVTSMKGLTIEILNTDAEGRLILCDALTYVERFKPAVVIDIATLTGACMVALGQEASGLFSNDDDLADALISAGDTVGDRAWRLPVWDEYQPLLKSNFADIANIGGRYAGAVTAACFLKRFADDYKWAHLDIAGTAWKGGANKGATGRPVGLLMQYLLDTLKA